MATGYLRKKFNGQTIISISNEIDTVMDLDRVMVLTTVQLGPPLKEAGHILSHACSMALIIYKNSSKKKEFACLWVILIIIYLPLCQVLDKLPLRSVAVYPKRIRQHMPTLSAIDMDMLII